MKIIHSIGLKAAWGLGLGTEWAILLGWILRPKWVWISQGCTIAPLDSCLVLRDESRNSRGNGFPRSSKGGYWAIEEPINAPSKGALYLTVRSAIIIIWRFVNQSGTCDSKLGFVGFPAPPPPQLLLSFILFLALINSPLWVPPSLLHSSSLKLSLCRAYICVPIHQSRVPFFPWAQSKFSTSFFYFSFFLRVLPFNL